MECRDGFYLVTLVAAGGEGTAQVVVALHAALAVFHLFDVSHFAVCDAGAEDDIERGCNVEDLRIDAENGDLTSSAGGGPVEGQLAFRLLGKFIHIHTKKL